MTLKVNNFHHSVFLHTAIKKRLQAILLAIALLLLFMLMSCRQSDTKPWQADGNSPDKALHIGIIPGAGNLSDWKAFHAGAQQAATMAKGIKLNWVPVAGTTGYDAQIRAVLLQVQNRADGIIIAPMDPDALLNPLEQAGLAGIPVVCVSPLFNNKGVTCFLTPQTAKLGSLAARKAGQLLQGQGQLLILLGDEASPSHRVLDSVFEVTIEAEFPEVNILKDSLFTGKTVTEAFHTAENLLIRFPQADAILCPSLAATKGMLKALRDIDKAGEIKLVGCGADESTSLAVIAGEIHAAVSHNYHKIGYQSLNLLLKIIGKSPINKTNQAGIEIITRENVLDSAVQAWLNPGLD